MASIRHRRAGFVRYHSPRNMYYEVVEWRLFKHKSGTCVLQFKQPVESIIVICRNTSKDNHEQQQYEPCTNDDVLPKSKYHHMSDEVLG